MFTALLVLAPEALACGGWGLTDLERGVQIAFAASRVRSGPDKAHLLSVREDLSPELAAWDRKADGGLLPPPDQRWEWRVDDVGLPHAMDGTRIVRDGQPVGEWIGFERLRLGDEEYVFTLALDREDFPANWYHLAVERDGERILEGRGTSLCLRPLNPEDQQREIRTRTAFYLAQTRAPGPIVPSIRRVTAAPADLPGRVAAEVTVGGSLGPAYGAEALTDGDRATAWCEGRAGLGLGAEIHVALGAPADPVLVLQQGYAKDRWRLTGNGQPRRLLARTDTGVVVEVTVPYAHDPAAPPLVAPLGAPGTTRIDLELIEAWPGAEWADTCLSELGVAATR